MTWHKKVRAVCLVALAFACLPGWGGGVTPAAGKKADRIVIVKSARTLTLMSRGNVLKTYKVALGGQPIGAKEQVGDHKTPEGIYSVETKIAHSKFHLGLLISYPNAADRERARKRGVKPGGSIEIHGLGSNFG
jgi:murein L,D-transpeptidase YafK